MHYPDGQEVLIGDVVRFVNDRGVVVGIIGTANFIAPLRAEDYADSGNGVLVKTDRGALVQFSDQEHLADMRFLLERRRDL